MRVGSMRGLAVALCLAGPAAAAGPLDAAALADLKAAYLRLDAFTQLRKIVQGPFKITPDYARVKTVGLTAEVAETYAAVQITEGWKMATDIAIPIPPAPAQTAPAPGK
jgi:hypothetical protein